MQMEERVAARLQQEWDGARKSDEASAYIRGVEDGEQSSKIDDLWDGGIEDYSERELSPGCTVTAVFCSGERWKGGTGSCCTLLAGDVTRKETLDPGRGV